MPSSCCNLDNEKLVRGVNRMARTNGFALALSLTVYLTRETSVHHIKFALVCLGVDILLEST